MVRRAIIGEFQGEKVMKMSEAGVEVATASEQELLFSSNASITFPSVIGETPRFLTNRYGGRHLGPSYTSQFGITFPAPPSVIISMVLFDTVGGQEVWGRYQGNFFTDNPEYGGFGVLFYGVVFTDRIQFWANTPFVQYQVQCRFLAFDPT